MSHDWVTTYLGDGSAPGFRQTICDRCGVRKEYAGKAPCPATVKPKRKRYPKLVLFGFVDASARSCKYAPNGEAIRPCKPLNRELSVYTVVGPSPLDMEANLRTRGPGPRVILYEGYPRVFIGRSMANHCPFCGADLEAALQASLPKPEPAKKHFCEECRGSGAEWIDRDSQEPFGKCANCGGRG